MNRLIGIDYGRKHLGVSLATSPLAEPVKTVTKRDFGELIEDLIVKHDIEALVVGVSEGLMADETRNFAKKIYQKFSLRVFLHDETLSSQHARQQAVRSGMRRKRREGKIDHLAAAHMLQDFIDTYDTLDKVPKTDRIG